MPLDPRTPVLIGAGQFSHRASDLNDLLDPAAMLTEAVRRAATDAGLATVPQPDSWRVVSILGWRPSDPAWVIADQLGLEARDTVVTTVGGNSPQSLVNATAEDIRRGQVDLVVLMGGEASRSRRLLRAADIRPEWPSSPADQVPRQMGEDLVLAHPHEMSRGIIMPVQVYPMFETAIRAAAGRTVEEQQKVASELWARFSEVAAQNPHAWIRTPMTAEQIRTPSEGNRMIGFPYTKSMNSNNHVDQAAALIMCSAAKAEALGVPRDRWVFPHSGTDCHEHLFVSERWNFADTPAIRLGGRMALELAGITIDDVELIDLYSCFPSAVQLGAASLGLSLERQLTLTGGLTFAGGPWNNYVMHSIATMVGALRAADPGARGLIWANGGYVTKHAFGVYSCTPPTEGFRWAHPQDEIDAMPRRTLAEDGSGPATIEAYTVMHSREGLPETALAALLLPDGRRAWGNSHDQALAAAMCEGEWIGRGVDLTPEGTITAV